MKGERSVGGITCGEVLDRLSDYLDQELDPEVRARVEEHLRGCDQCARFGGEFAATIRALRDHLLREGPAPARIHERLRGALDAEPDPRKRED
jgi:anti-sigma factor RsiW